MTPEEFELLSELTIVMPTCNRPLNLERAIEYWRDMPVTVHILDGSEKPWIPIGALQDVPLITYHHRPCEEGQNPSLDVMMRLVSGAELSNTNYSAVCNDDDFYTVTGLIDSLKILQRRNDIDAVAGTVLTYQRKKNLYWYFKYRPRNNHTDLKTELVPEKLLTRSSWFLYAVCKTEVWKTFIKISYEEKGFSEANHFAHEWMMFILSKAMFRTNYVNVVTEIRQDTVAGANKEPDVPWGDFINNTKNVERVGEIAEQLSKGFNRVTPVCDHPRNLQLARETLCLEQARTLIKLSTPPITQSLKSLAGNILFFLAPGLNIFSDRPRRLKYLWQSPRSESASGQKQEIEKIEKLLLKPREELRLRADI